MSQHILLLEDDKVIGESLKFALEQQGYAVSWGKDIRSAKKFSEDKLPDLYLLDWNLPDGTGLEWSKEIRSYDEDVPIIFITARSDEESAIKALRMGANDYIRKPFGKEELLLRIKKSLKEVLQPLDELKFGSICIEKSQRLAFVNGVKLDLTKKEYEILEILLKRAPSVVDRNVIIETIDKDLEMTGRTVDSHISKLRRKIRNVGVSDVEVTAVSGIGYKLEKIE